MTKKKRINIQRKKKQKKLTRKNAHGRGGRGSRESYVFYNENVMTTFSKQKKVQSDP